MARFDVLSNVMVALLSSGTSTSAFHVLGDEIDFEVDARRPVARAPSVVTASVCGITATRTASSSRRAATVRLMPSTVIEPLCTT